MSTRRQRFIHGGSISMFLPMSTRNNFMNQPVGESQMINNIDIQHKLPIDKRIQAAQQQARPLSTEEMQLRLNTQNQQAENIRLQPSQDRAQAFLERKQIEADDALSGKAEQNSLEKTDFGPMNRYKPLLTKLLNEQDYTNYWTLKPLFPRLEKFAPYLDKETITQFLQYWLSKAKLTGTSNLTIPGQINYQTTNGNVVLDEWNKALESQLFSADELSTLLKNELSERGSIAQAIALAKIEASKSSAQRGFEKFGKVFSKVADGLSTAVSFIPGIGTAASAGLDAANYGYQYGSEYLDNKELQRYIKPPNYETDTDEEDDEKGGSLQRHTYRKRSKRKKAFKPIVSGTKRMKWIKRTKPLVPLTMYQTYNTSDTM